MLPSLYRYFPTRLKKTKLQRKEFEKIRLIEDIKSFPFIFLLKRNSMKIFIVPLNTCAMKTNFFFYQSVNSMNRQPYFPCSDGAFFLRSTKIWFIKNSLYWNHLSTVLKKEIKKQNNFLTFTFWWIVSRCCFLYIFILWQNVL